MLQRCEIPLQLASFAHLIEPKNVTEGILAGVKAQLLCILVQHYRITLKRYPALAHRCRSVRGPSSVRETQQVTTRVGLLKPALYCVARKTRVASQVRKHLEPMACWNSYKEKKVEGYLLLRGLHPQAFCTHSVANYRLCSWCTPFGLMFAALRARERTAHARSHHLAFQHAIAGSDSAFGSMRLLAELKEHHGCVNHVSFSSFGAG